MTGAFRRAILVEVGQASIEARLEDDFHRFDVRLTHDGRTVTAVEGQGERFPWATCQEAPSALNALVGAPVAADPTALFRHTEPRAQCTHLFELAALALAQWRHGCGRRLFEAEVSDPQGEARRVRLWRDGEQIAEWRLAGERIAAPAAYAGRGAGDFPSRGLAALPPDEAEALLILRRVIQTARARQMNVDAFPTAAAMGRPPYCYSLQPVNAVRAARRTGQTRDWPDRKALVDQLSRGFGGSPAAPRRTGRFPDE